MMTGESGSTRAPSVHAVHPGGALGSAPIDDEQLAVMLVRLYARDAGETLLVADLAETTRRCKQAILQRLIRDDFRVYISRLIRDLYLSEEGLSAGFGIEDAWEFWQWFDRCMWPSPSSWEAHGE